MFKKLLLPTLCLLLNGILLSSDSDILPSGETNTLDASLYFVEDDDGIFHPDNLGSDEGSQSLAEILLAGYRPVIQISTDEQAMNIIVALHPLLNDRDQLNRITLKIPDSLSEHFDYIAEQGINIDSQGDRENININTAAHQQSTSRSPLTDNNNQLLKPYKKFCTRLNDEFDIKTLGTLLTELTNGTLSDKDITKLTKIKKIDGRPLLEAKKNTDSRAFRIYFARTKEGNLIICNANIKSGTHNTIDPDQLRAIDTAKKAYNKHIENIKSEQLAKTKRTSEEEEEEEEMAVTKKSKH